MNRSTVPTMQEPLSSSDARDAILSHHEALRALVVETIHAAEEATPAEQGLEIVRARARTLYEALAAHMRFEEEILATALRDVIGWGAALQAEIEADHGSQRASLAEALAALDSPRPSKRRFLANLRTFVRALLLDMAAEEQRLLAADLDALAIDVPGG